jgi:hypothetical protein
MTLVRRPNRGTVHRLGHPLECEGYGADWPDDLGDDFPLPVALIVGSLDVVADADDSSVVHPLDYGPGHKQFLQRTDVYNRHIPIRHFQPPVSCAPDGQRLVVDGNAVVSSKLKFGSEHIYFGNPVHFSFSYSESPSAETIAALREPAVSGEQFSIATQRGWPSCLPSMNANTIISSPSARATTADSNQIISTSATRHRNTHHASQPNPAHVSTTQTAVAPPRERCRFPPPVER